MGSKHPTFLSAAIDPYSTALRVQRISCKQIHRDCCSIHLGPEERRGLSAAAGGLSKRYPLVHSLCSRPLLTVAEYLFRATPLRVSFGSDGCRGKRKRKPSPRFPARVAIAPSKWRAAKAEELLNLSLPFHHLESLIGASTSLIPSLFYLRILIQISSQSASSPRLSQSSGRPGCADCWVSVALPALTAQHTSDALPCLLWIVYKGVDAIQISHLVTRPAHSIINQVSVSCALGC